MQASSNDHHDSNDGSNVTVAREKRNEIWRRRQFIFARWGKYNIVRSIFGKLLPALLFAALVLVFYPISNLRYQSIKILNFPNLHGYRNMSPTVTNALG